MIDCASLEFLTQICGVLAVVSPTGNPWRSTVFPVVQKHVSLVTCLALSTAHCFLKIMNVHDPAFYYNFLELTFLGLCLWKSQVKGCILKDCILLPTRPPDRAAPPIGLDWGEDERCSASKVLRGQLDTVHNNQNILSLFCPKAWGEWGTAHYKKKKKKILLVTGPDTQRVQSMSRGKIIIMPDSPYKVCLEWETRNPFPLQPLFSPHVPNDAYPILGVLAPSGECSRQ